MGRLLAEYNPDEPRDEGGRWTSDGEGGGGGSIGETENNIRNNSYESAAVYDKNGKEILFKKGDSGTVKFTPEEKAKMKGATVTHNHPSGQSFSVQDIQMVQALKLEKLRVVSKGVSYEFIPPPNGLKPTWQAIYHETEVKVNNKLYDEVQAGKISEQVALKQIDDKIMSAFSKKIRATYRKTES